MTSPLTAEQARLADREDQAALALHVADKAAGRRGVSLGELDEALDRIAVSDGIDGQAGS